MRVHRVSLGFCLIFLILNAPSASAAPSSPTASKFTSNLELSVVPRFNATALTLGFYHTCALTSEGAVKCWGNNNVGQLGNGSTVESHIPTNVNELNSGVTAIRAGGYHTCAITSSGTLKCWGQNYYGQLGDGTTVYRYTPVNVSGLNGTAAVAAGGFHTCALTNSGGVKCWGSNSSGELGDGTTTDRQMPVDVAGLTSGVVAITAGDEHTCALTNSGGVKCWGDNFFGQLGDGTSGFGNHRTTPGNVVGLNSGVAAIAAGSSYTCALTGSGGIKCWGENASGELGDGTTIDRLTPVNVSGLTSGVTAITAGRGQSCALVSGGSVKCWGSNTNGQVGDGTTTPRLTPVDVSGLTQGINAIAAGDGRTCALASDSIKCWGRNFFGELGDGGFLYRTQPMNVNGANGSIAVAAGWLHTCALTNNGGAKCWGLNWLGQLGDGTTMDRITPVPVSGLMSGIRVIAPGESHTCALTNSGGVKCWGDNRYGQIGDGTTTLRTVPVDVNGLNSSVIAIAAGAYHTCAISRGGSAKCWGDNRYGQIGDGTTVSHTIPVNVSGLSSGVVAITAGGGHTCALNNLGRIKCWGQNSSGQLGDGTNVERHTPVDVIGLTGNSNAVTTGGAHTCTLMASGKVKCWGTNWAGQLGDGTTGDRWVPVDVYGLNSGVMGISAGVFHTCALTSGGGVKCWGFNANGAVGDGTTTLRTTPVNVSGLSGGVTSISAGENHACALIASDEVKCWGFNYYGQLGNGEAGHRTTPTNVAWFQWYFPFISK